MSYISFGFYKLYEQHYSQKVIKVYFFILKCDVTDCNFNFLYSGSLNDNGMIHLGTVRYVVLLTTFILFSKNLNPWVVTRNVVMINYPVTIS